MIIKRNKPEGRGGQLQNNWQYKYLEYSTADRYCTKNATISMKSDDWRNEGWMSAWFCVNHYTPYKYVLTTWCYPWCIICDGEMHYNTIHLINVGCRHFWVNASISYHLSFIIFGVCCDKHQYFYSYFNRRQVLSNISREDNMAYGKNCECEPLSVWCVHLPLLQSKYYFLRKSHMLVYYVFLLFLLIIWGTKRQEQKTKGICRGERK